jgi:3-hydroxyacyl-CoA dehydrogenase
MVEKGWLGKKTEKGFYLYPKSAKKGADRQLNPEMLSILKEFRASSGLGDKPANVSEEDIQMRIISRFINEAAFCLQGVGFLF